MVVDENVFRRDSASDTTHTLQASIFDIEDKENTSEAAPSAREDTNYALSSPHGENPESHHVQPEKEAEAESEETASGKEATEYPTGIILLLINLSLCLSVFLTALVCLWRPFCDLKCLICLLTNGRITRSSQLYVPLSDNRLPSPWVFPKHEA
jgi:hypothetical protein